LYAIRCTALKGALIQGHFFNDFVKEAKINHREKTEKNKAKNKNPIGRRFSQMPSEANYVLKINFTFTQRLKCI